MFLEGFGFDVAISRDVEDGFEERRLSDRPTGIVAEMKQQVEFAWRQIHWFPGVVYVDGNHAAVGVDAQVVIEDLNRGWKTRFDPREQLADVEGFGHVIAGAQNESDFQVADAVAYGQEDDRNLISPFANLAANRQTVGFRHLDVEDDDVRVFALPHVEGFMAVVCRNHPVALTLEGRLDERDNIGIIVGNEHF